MIHGLGVIYNKVAKRYKDYQFLIHFIRRKLYKILLIHFFDVRFLFFFVYIFVLRFEYPCLYCFHLYSQIFCPSLRHVRDLT